MRFISILLLLSFVFTVQLSAQSNCTTPYGDPLNICRAGFDICVFDRTRWANNGIGPFCKPAYTQMTSNPYNITTYVRSDGTVDMDALTAAWGPNFSMPGAGGGDFRPKDARTFITIYPNTQRRYLQTVEIVLSSSRDSTQEFCSSYPTTDERDHCCDNYIQSSNQDDRDRCKSIPLNNATFGATPYYGRYRLRYYEHAGDMSAYFNPNDTVSDDRDAQSLVEGLRVVKEIFITIDENINDNTDTFILNPGENGELLRKLRFNVSNYGVIPAHDRTSYVSVQYLGSESRAILGNMSEAIVSDADREILINTLHSEVDVKDPFPAPAPRNNSGIHTTTFVNPDTPQYVNLGYLFADYIGDRHVAALYSLGEPASFRCRMFGGTHCSDPCFFPDGEDSSGRSESTESEDINIGIDELCFDSLAGLINVNGTGISQQYLEEGGKVVLRSNNTPEDETLILEETIEHHNDEGSG